MGDSMVRRGEMLTQANSGWQGRHADDGRIH